MVNDELLLSISELLDKKFYPVEQKLEKEILSIKDEVKLVKDEVKLVKDEVKLVKDEVKLVKDEVKLVRDEVHVINLKLENIIEPRLDQIESCYLDTYKRYQYGTDKIDKLELDNQLIRSRIQTHDEILRRNQIA